MRDKARRNKQLQRKLSGIPILANNNIFLFFVAFILFILMATISPDRFLSIANLQSMAYQIPEFGLLSLSMTLIIFTGGINLSLVFSAVLPMIFGGLILSNFSSYSFEVSIIICILTVLFVSVMCGTINGYLISYLKVNSILITLGSMTLFEGISLNITRGGSISGFPESFVAIGSASILGIPLVLLIYLLIFYFTYILLNKTSFGIRLLSIGSNQKVAQFSGVSVNKIIFYTYIYASLIAGVAGIILSSRYNSIKASYGSSYLLQSVAASLLGGIDIHGGRGTISGTFWAVLILQIMSNGLNILGLNRYLTVALMGFILIFVVIIFNKSQHR